MNSKNKALIKPFDESLCKPISIDWDGKHFAKVTKWFENVVRKNLKENPPRRYRQIIFFYEGNDLKYLKPFNI